MVEFINSNNVVITLYVNSLGIKGTCVNNILYETFKVIYLRGGELLELQ